MLLLSLVDDSLHERIDNAYRIASVIPENIILWAIPRAQSFNNLKKVQTSHSLIWDSLTGYVFYR